MTVSLPSKKVVIVDIPEVTNFKGTFVYNFFTANERTTSEVKKTLPDSIKNRTQISDGTEDSFVDSNNFNRFTPRYVRLSWTPKNSASSTANYVANTYSIADNLDSLYNESSFTVDDFSSVTFQDNNFSSKLSFFTSRMLDEAVNNSTNSNSPLNIASSSLLDDVRFLKSNASDSVSDSFLADSYVRLKEEGQIFRDQTNPRKEKVIETKVDRLNKIKSRVQLNNKIIKKALGSIQESTLYLNDPTFYSVLSDAEQTQKDSIANSPSSLVTSDDYDIEIENVVDIRPVDPSGFVPDQYVIGYVIRKTEIDLDGGRIPHNPIVVESPNVGTLADTEVRYGIIYEYTIETVSLLTAQVADTVNNQVVVISFMVASKPSPVIPVDCNEYLPPEWPADFTVQWDYIKGLPRLSWCFPVNLQQDVKHFQVFRRKTINEPFELIKQYSFDDSLIPSISGETPDPNLVEVISAGLGPKTMFIDTDFKADKNDSYIYSVCSIDAHGYSSNYSVQLRATFNRFNNKLVRELISKAGAPKAYPNMRIEQDMFVDTMKDSGHSEIKVYFMPEYLEVYDKNGTDLSLLSKLNNGKSKFQLQMINVDLQEQKTFDIHIQDLRSSSKKQ